MLRLTPTSIQLTSEDFVQARRWLLGLGLAVAIALLAWSWRSTTIVDTDEALFPAPASLTNHRIDVLSIVVDQMKQSTGMYPAALEEVDTKNCRSNRRCDGWGHPIKYTRTATGYELRSAGPDGVVGNADDIVYIGPHRGDR